VSKFEKRANELLRGVLLRALKYLNFETGAALLSMRIILNPDRRYFSGADLSQAKGGLVCICFSW
jgi:hypothetical protein